MECVLDQLINIQSMCCLSGSLWSLESSQFSSCLRLIKFYSAAAFIDLNFYLVYKKAFSIL